MVTLSLSLSVSILYLTLFFPPSSHPSHSFSLFFFSPGPSQTHEKHDTGYYKDSTRKLKDNKMLAKCRLLSICLSPCQARRQNVVVHCLFPRGTRQDILPIFFSVQLHAGCGNVVHCLSTSRVFLKNYINWCPRKLYTLDTNQLTMSERE